MGSVVHNQDELLDKMVKEYEEDGTAELQEDEAYMDVALEYFSYNTTGGYTGKDTPGFATLITKEN